MYFLIITELTVNQEIILFRLNLILRRKTANIMLFSPAPWFRILFLVFAGMIVLGIITVSSDEETGNYLIPVLIIAASVFAALYEESWLFDREEKTVRYKSGFLFLHRNKIWTFNEVENLELYKFLRGAESDGSADHEINLTKPFSRQNTAEVKEGYRIIHPKYHQEIRMHLKSGEMQTIESIDSRNTEPLEKKALILAEFSGISLLK